MRAWLIAGLALAGVLVWLWRSSTPEPTSSPRAVESPRPPVATPRTPTAPVLASRPRHATLPPPRPFDPARQHTADPCTALRDPVIPQGFEQITEANITIAWDPAELGGPLDRPLRPVALAHAVAGILEEAAQLTGTDRRPQLTVIVDASPDALQSRTRTPAWVGGLYDGGAVHVPAKPTADLGVAMATLRHELMHAQIHAAVGCVPFWFNEGLADYFAGDTPVREWVAMVREREPFDLAVARDPVVLDLEDHRAGRLYAVSLAMVVYLVHRGGERALREAVRTAQSADSPLALWELLHPRVDHPAIVESLAAKLFGASGPELDAMLRGPLCCRKLRQPAELACRAPSADGGPREVCRRW